MIAINAATARGAPLRGARASRRRTARAAAAARAVLGGERWLTHAPADYLALEQCSVKGVRANSDVGTPTDSGRPLLKLATADGSVGVGAWACTTGARDSEPLGPILGLWHSRIALGVNGVDEEGVGSAIDMRSKPCVHVPLAPTECVRASREQAVRAVASWPRRRGR